MRIRESKQVLKGEENSIKSLIRKKIALRKLQAVSGFQDVCVGHEA